MKRSTSKSFAVVCGLGLAAAAVLIVPEMLKSRASVASAPTAEEQAPAPPPKTKLDTFTERLNALTDLPSGIALARSYFDDASDQPDPAGVVFALWADHTMTWATLQKVEETKRALVMKDSLVERGYRVCTSGSVVQISVERHERTTLATGIMLNGSFEPTHFLAVGSTGDLVEKSQARFCGVVVGRYVYGNSGGGSSHAITLVGMFDLPENKTKPKP
jgi:hypothetical protein